MSDSAPRTDDLTRMEEILRAESVCHLGLVDEHGVAHVVPLNHTYSRGRILFHCALEGRKLDLLRARPEVCVEVSRQAGEPTPHAGDLCDSGFASVICWGTARVVEDIAERQEILNEFQARYDTPSVTREPISRERAASCGAVEIILHRMTGRLWGPGANERWEWTAG